MNDKVRQAIGTQMVNSYSLRVSPKTSSAGVMDEVQFHKIGPKPTV